MKWFLQDFPVHLVRIFIVEGRKARQHFIEKNSESPPINCFSITVAKEKFGCEILRCAAESWFSLSYDCLLLKALYLLFVRSSSFMSNLHSPKSQRAMWPW